MAGVGGERGSLALQAERPCLRLCRSPCFCRARGTQLVTQLLQPVGGGPEVRVLPRPPVSPTGLGCRQSAPSSRELPGTCL